MRTALVILDKVDRPDLDSPSDDYVLGMGLFGGFLIMVIIAVFLKRVGLTRKRFQNWLGLTAVVWTAILVLVMLAFLFRR